MRGGLRSVVKRGLDDCRRTDRKDEGGNERKIRKECLLGLIRNPSFFI